MGGQSTPVGNAPSREGHVPIMLYIFLGPGQGTYIGPRSSESSLVREVTLLERGSLEPSACCQYVLSLSKLRPVQRVLFCATAKGRKRASREPGFVSVCSDPWVLLLYCRLWLLFDSQGSVQ